MFLLLSCKTAYLQFHQFCVRRQLRYYNLTLALRQHWLKKLLLYDLHFLICTIIDVSLSMLRYIHFQIDFKLYQHNH